MLLAGRRVGAVRGVSIRWAAAADEPRASAHVSAGTGLVGAVDAGTNTLVLVTRSGAQRVHASRAATIRHDHDAALALGAITPRDPLPYSHIASLHPPLPPPPPQLPPLPT